MSTQYDVIIAGGGMVGASLALQLNHNSAGQMKILVVEPHQLQADSYQPSFDARSSALTYGCRLIFEKLGLWRRLSQQLANIETIHVSERGRFGSVLLEAGNLQLSQLGYVVDNAWLGQVLLQEVARQPAIEWRCPAKVSSAQCLRGGIRVGIQQAGQVEQLDSQLLVVADGVNSSLRQQLGIVAERQDYQQTAIITNVSFSQPHEAWAYERFTDWGPMALLPLTDDAQGQPRSALVWTMPVDQAEHLCQLADSEFLQQLQQRFGNRQGRFSRVGERHQYPLALVQAQEQVRSGLVVMGNAAHAMHPVAGQGFNLALRDCVRLAELLVVGHRRAEPLGRLSLLNRYFDQQLPDQFKTIGFSDQLTKLFTRYQGGLSLLRNLGLMGLDVLPPLKREFARHATGINDGAAVGALR